MSKLSFRARALDSTKPMPVFRSEEVPDLPDFAAINRAVPQMPTGMEKEEECVCILFYFFKNKDF
jgi:enhancer of polycomb-like protein